MKKFLSLSACLLAALVVCAACGDSSKNSSQSHSSSYSQQSSVEGETYTVTFKQAGQADILRVVTIGADLTDIPTPAKKTGYTVTWESANFENVQQSFIVNAVEKANDYVITYDANGGKVSTNQQTVTFDKVPTSFALPTRSGYEFTGWKYGDKVLSAADAWKHADNVTLVATWKKKAAMWTKFY